MDAPRRNRSAGNPEVDLLHRWRMATEVVPSLLLALHPLRLRRANTSLQISIHALARSLARALNPALVPDLHPKISIKCGLIFVLGFFPHLLTSPVVQDSFLMVMMGSRSKAFVLFYFTLL